MNTVQLFGRLTRDPDVSWKEGRCITKFVLAIDRYNHDADFIRCTSFGKVAEAAGKFLRKGRQVAVLGNIKTGSYKDKDGKTVFTNDVWVDKIDFVSSTKKSDIREDMNDIGLSPENVMDNFELAEEDIPFGG